MEEEGYSGEIRCVIVGRMRLGQRGESVLAVRRRKQRRGRSYAGDIVEESWRVCSWRF